MLAAIWGCLTSNPMHYSLALVPLGVIAWGFWDRWTSRTEDKHSHD